jgi:hypothetical protein
MNQPAGLELGDLAVGHPALPAKLAPPKARGSVLTF